MSGWLCVTELVWKDVREKLRLGLLVRFLEMDGGGWKESQEEP